MGRYLDGYILGNVACRLLGSFLHNKTAKSSQVNILSVDNGTFDSLHERLHRRLYSHLFNPGRSRNLVNNIRFRHFLKYLIIYYSLFIFSLQIYIFSMKFEKNKTFFT